MLLLCVILTVSLLLDYSDALLENVKTSRIVVFGATGRTGKEIVNKLKDKRNIQIICPVRDMGKGRRLLGPDSKEVTIVPLDIDRDSETKILRVLDGASAVVCAAAYSPSGFPDPFGAYKVDFLGTKKTIDASIRARVPKYVLVTSLLTNGIAAGQALNPQYLLLNAFGGVLLCKRKAEEYLQSQSKVIKSTIIRPGGLSEREPDSPILYGSADTIFGGSISRKQVAEVVAEACFLSESDGKIVEIISTMEAENISPAIGFLNV